jgi:hypothetical protein
MQYREREDSLEMTEKKTVSIRNIHGRAPKVLVVNIAKSGTHLMDSILKLIPPLKRLEKAALNDNLKWHPLNFLPFVGRETCISGIGRPQQVKLLAMNHALSRIRPGYYAMAQIPYQRSVVRLIEKHGILPVALIRDPRDIVVSRLHQIMSTETHFLHTVVKALSSDHERLKALIVGTHSARGEVAIGIAQQLDFMLDWVEDSTFLTLRFEDLVGSQGGGNNERQQQTILSLADYLGLSLDAEAARIIGKEMFGKGRTFRKGQIGSWQDYFDDEITALFEHEVGERFMRLGYMPAL